MLPAFDAKVTSYTAATTNETNKITATPADGAAQVAVTVNGAASGNNAAATWNEGENMVKITVTRGAEETVYTVAVTKETA